MQLNLEGSHSPPVQVILPVRPIVFASHDLLAPSFLPVTCTHPRWRSRAWVLSWFKSRFCHLLLEWLQAEGLLTLGLSFPFFC